VAQKSSSGPADLTLARVLRPWGRRGEVAAEVLTDFPQHLTGLREVWLADGRELAREFTVRTCRLHLGQAIFHFEGVDSINEAERLRGVEVRVPLSERVALAAGSYYINELVGCAVWDGNGARLGSVSEVERCGDKAEHVIIPDSWVLVVTTPAGELLIPFAAKICTRVDPFTRRIDVQLPDGLRELNSGAETGGRNGSRR
jgi:16S rRNA processing protein RimM